MDTTGDRNSTDRRGEASVEVSKTAPLQRNYFFFELCDTVSVSVALASAGVTDSATNQKPHLFNLDACGFTRWCKRAHCIYDRHGE
jgi:hypothetical protein